MIEVEEKDLKKLISKAKKKQGRFSKRIVALVIFLNVIFTAAVLYVFMMTNGSEPTTLIVSWFAFTTGELWMLSSIKKKEVKEENKEDLRG